MFGYASRAVLSFLLLATAVTAAPVGVDVSALEARQGSCLSALARPNPSNNSGRVSFQRNIDRILDGTFMMDNLITVHIRPAIAVHRSRLVTVEVNNAGSQGNTVLLSNYLNTLTDTQPREQIRVDIGPRTVSGGTITNADVTRCVQLPRLDGTWYIQVER